MHSQWCKKKLSRILHHHDVWFKGFFIEPSILHSLQAPLRLHPRTFPILFSFHHAWQSTPSFCARLPSQRARCWCAEISQPLSHYRLCVRVSFMFTHLILIWHVCFAPMKEYYLFNLHNKVNNATRRCQIRQIYRIRMIELTMEFIIALRYISILRSLCLFTKKWKSTTSSSSLMKELFQKSQHVGDRQRTHKRMETFSFNTENYMLAISTSKAQWPDPSTALKVKIVHEIDLISQQKAPAACLVAPNRRQSDILRLNFWRWQSNKLFEFSCQQLCHHLVSSAVGPRLTQGMEFFTRSRTSVAWRVTQ